MGETPSRIRGAGFVHAWERVMLHVALLVFRAPSGPAAREIATREPTARSGRSRSPPVPSGPSGALYAGGACVAGVSLGASSRSRAWSRRRPRAPQLGQRGYCASSTFACNSSVTISVFELASLELQRFWVLLKVHAIELHAESLVCVSVVTYGHRSRSLLEARPVPPVPPPAAHTDRLLLSG